MGVGQAHVGGHPRGLRPLQLGDDRAGRGILRREVDGRRAVIPGQHPVGGREVVAGVVVHRADDRHLVHHPRVIGQEFRDRDARHARAHRPQRAAELGGGLGLRVVGLVLGRAAVEPDQDHGEVPGGRAAVRLRPGLGPQDVGEAQSREAQEARPEEVPTTPTIAASGGSAGQLQHRRLLSGCGARWDVRLETGRDAHRPRFEPKAPNPAGRPDRLSVVELELLGVDQGPDDVLVGLASLVGPCGQVVQGAGGLAARRGAAEGGPEEFLDLLRVGAAGPSRAPRHGRRPRRACPAPRRSSGASGSVRGWRRSRARTRRPCRAWDGRTCPGTSRRRSRRAARSPGSPPAGRRRGSARPRPGRWRRAGPRRSSASGSAGRSSACPWRCTRSGCWRGRRPGWCRWSGPAA